LKFSLCCSLLVEFISEIIWDGGNPLTYYWEIVAKSIHRKKNQHQNWMKNKNFPRYITPFRNMKNVDLFIEIKRLTYFTSNFNAFYMQNYNLYGLLMDHTQNFFLISKRGSVHHVLLWVALYNKYISKRVGTGLAKWTETW
jgi:hypothetical protein